MHKIQIFLKSGQTIEFTCENAEFSWSKETGKYVAYKLQGIKEYDQVNLEIEQIAGYTTKKR